MTEEKIPPKVINILMDFMESDEFSKIEDRVESEGVGVINPLGCKEFVCMECKSEFDRSDCNKDNATRFNSVKRCPLCKGHRIFRSKETLSDAAAERKYSPDIEQSITGLKGNKYFSYAQGKAASSGKMRRKK